MQRSVFILGVVLSYISCSIPLRGQSVLNGRIEDRDTGEPLAFVNIVYNEKGTGTVSTLDGFFTIESGVLPEFLKLSYVGYESLTVYPSEADQLEPMLLTMKRNPFLIEEVKVYPGINPAHRIIGAAFRNRRNNNPEMLSSFSYTSYNKLYFTLLPDSLLSRSFSPGSPDIPVSFNFSGRTGNHPKADSDSLHTPGDYRDMDIPVEENGFPPHEQTGPGSSESQPQTGESADSGETGIRELVEKQHIFLMESVSNRDYLRPGRNNERVIASRVSGFQDPSFSLLATQLQSFSFYGDFISLLDRRYLNPISRGSTSKYSFILEDSLLTEQNDTLFVISFRPYPNRNFDGLRGVVYINSNHYAVQNVIAEPSEPRGFMTIRVQQNYSYVDNRQWFPVELNTDIILGGESGSSGSESGYRLIGIGKSYLSDVSIEPDLRRRDFNHVELTISPSAHRQNEELWNKYRTEPLSDKDLKTYHVLDSIGQEDDLDRALQTFEALATGYLPWGYFNIDLASLIDFNYFEGLRPGVRLLSNDIVSERFRFGGHVAMGTRDRKLKYGGQAGLIIYRPGDIHLKFSYSNDVAEPGSYGFLGRHSAFSSENYRRFLIGRMDYVKEYNTSLNLRFMRYFRSSLYFSASQVRPGDNYVYVKDGEDRHLFRFSEAGVQLRFACREKFMQTPRGNRISMGTDFPVLWINYGQGLNFAHGEYQYTRLQAGAEQNFMTKRLGKTTLTVEGGITRGDVPVTKLYNGKGSHRSISIESANSFGAMRMNEFVSDEFISFFFRQNFESLLFRTGRFRPEIVFVTNAGFGTLSDAGKHMHIPLKTMEKGYYESGLLFNNIYRQFFAGYGLGIFYRYGPYAFDEHLDNFSFKLTFSISLR